MTFPILIVCEANVCRSPMAAALLRQSLVRYQHTTDIEILNCGTHTSPDGSSCELNLDASVLEPCEYERLICHRPTQISGPLLRQAGLILTADRRIRTAAVRLAPNVHDRAFTLREAAVLAQYVVRTNCPSGRGDKVAWLESLVAEMNDGRGLVAMPSNSSHRRTRFPWPCVTVHGNDIPDHHQGPAPYAVVRDLLLASCADLSAALTWDAR